MYTVGTSTVCVDGHVPREYRGIWKGCLRWAHRMTGGDGGREIRGYQDEHLEGMTEMGHGMAGGDGGVEMMGRKDGLLKEVSEMGHGMAGGDGGMELGREEARSATSISGDIRHDPSGLLSSYITRDGFLRWTR